jgi:hypothetical protein
MLSLDRIMKLVGRETERNKVDVDGSVHINRFRSRTWSNEYDQCIIKVSSICVVEKSFHKGTGSDNKQRELPRERALHIERLV